jgi:hypothetical protein
MDITVFELWWIGAKQYMWPVLFTAAFLLLRLRWLERRGLFFILGVTASFGAETIVFLLWDAMASRLFLPGGVVWTDGQAKFHEAGHLATLAALSLVLLILLARLRGFRRAS